MRVMQSMMKNKNKDQTAELGNTKSDARVGPPAGLWYAQNIPNAPSRDNEISLLRPADGIAEQQSADNIQQQSATSTSLPTRAGGRPFVDNGKDVIDRDIISMATARQLFETCT